MARKEEGFIFRYCWAEELLKLPKDLRGRINDAIQRFALYGEEPADEYLKYTMYAVIRNQILRDREKYQEVCEKRRDAINTRWEREHEAQVNTNNTNVFKSIQVNTNDTNNTNKGNVSKGNKGNISKKSKQTPNVNENENETDFLLGITEDFREIVKEWFAYKQERGERYKSKQAMRHFLTRLQRISNNDPKTAKEIVYNSMANNWAGIFEQKENQQRKDDGKHSISSTLHPQMCDYGKSTF